MIFVANKKRNPEKIKKDFPGANIFDITSSAPTLQGRKLSPFYPHKNIPIPGDSNGMTATCVEAIWQGLKVFENVGIDTLIFQNDTMRNIKRTVRKYGKPLGHQYGVFSKTILNYADAKRYIYIPSYRYMLENVPSVCQLVKQLRERSITEDIVLLDYNINPDNRDLSKPLSHAELLKMYIEGRYPENDDDFIHNNTYEELTTLYSFQKRTKKTTTDDELILIQQITKLLQKAEYSAKEIVTLLSIKGGTRAVNKILKKIPNLKSRTEKYYTLSTKEDSTTLFLK